MRSHYLKYVLQYILLLGDVKLFKFWNLESQDETQIWNFDSTAFLSQKSKANLLCGNLHKSSANIKRFMKCKALSNDHSGQFGLISYLFFCKM